MPAPSRKASQGGLSVYNIKYAALDSASRNASSFSSAVHAGPRTRGGIFWRWDVLTASLLSTRSATSSASKTKPHSNSTQDVFAKLASKRGKTECEKPAEG
ncbi:hypothetical protein K438DRAFT_1762209 [Mycena galopus ATCC 62051]|nr:hypothetical protein K438DRAFT_1762209 [Mycena galopus ATCC 62051]